jgi:hypothetical protein
MHIGKGPASTLKRNARRAMIIRRHRRLLEREVRELLGEAREDERDEETPQP